MVTTPRLRALLLMAALCSAACRPSIEGRASLVDRDVVLAIQSVPAETGPGKPVQYNVLYAGIDGAADAKALDWALCSARKPLAASGSVALACFEPSGAALSALGTGATVKGQLAKDACQLFGPTPPPPEKGQPNGRPADADTTGGYFQPVRLLERVQGEQDAYAFGMTRLLCGVLAAQDQAAEFGQRYRPNENPVLDTVVLRRGADTEPLTDQADKGQAVRVKPGETVTFRASWAPCPRQSRCGDGICGPREDLTNCAADCQTTPKGCTGSEWYAYFDPAHRVVVDRRESIRVSWYANDGEFAHDRTGTAEAQGATMSTDNAWTAPPSTGQALIWVVIRDDRGGVSWKSYKLDVAR
ncbi:MAG TPA: hypothetical protein VF331_02515 [Polyangiales bacterium]